MRLFLLTAFALVAFAANSLLARLALTQGGISPASFTLIRIVSGAVVLALIVGAARARGSGSWRGGAALLAYAAFFSFAYMTLPAGTGALILFASVQLTMFGAGLLCGDRLHLLQWGGVGLAVSGLIYLLLPGVSAPHPLGALIMAASGAAWGIYSLLGRGGTDPTAQTAGNFWRAAVIALPLAALSFAVSPEPMPAKSGVFYALASGVVTSGLGYAVWYAALKSLTALRAGIVQLSVPPLAAIGGVMFLSEALTLRLGLASALILAGVYFALRRVEP